MKRKEIVRLAFAVAAAAVFFTSAPLRAAAIDDLAVDASIGPAFQGTYVYKTYLKDDAINAEAKAGVVTLTGTVAEEYHKMLAQETVASLPGVTGVDNQLVTKAELAAENADGWIVRKVKLALMFHQNVNASATAVEAKDGIVTLKGEASSLAQKELVTEYAKDIEGVTEVKNEMTVAATPEPAERTASEKIDDMSITAQVKTALLTHRSTSSVKTQVVTRNGVVMLTGIAKNDAEKSLVSKLVADIQGVSSVNNEMTVEPAVTQ
jgi:hyperosmotically inducible periplasmic protein